MYCGLLYCFSTFVLCQSAIYDHELYFEDGDETRADCIAPSAVRYYTYLGDRSHAITGEKCLIWKVAHDEIVKNLSKKPHELRKYQNSVVKAEEVMLHNKCRRWELPHNHPWTTPEMMRATRKGPWCYVKRKSKIVAESCFKFCTGPPREEQTEPEKSHYGEKEEELNYNALLIENIQKYYKSYSWGDVSYYRWNPSDDTFSAEYYRIRQQIFYGCVGTVIFLVLWLLLCSYLRKEAAASRRRREEALKLIFPHRKIQLHPVVRPHVS